MIEASWDKIKDVLDCVLELAPEQRPGYLDAYCSDPQIRQSVAALIESYEESSSFFREPPIFDHLQDNDSWIGRKLGPYKVLEEIGAGGMGVVYRAVRADDEYNQHVAIKIVGGLFISKVHLERFRIERQILANLNHPNIARLLDGGTTPEGLPFLVMEFIEGAPIGEYCNRQRLPVRKRLELFLQVCAAVQFAHQNLVVHRDLKPGNILVTAEGMPKLLDFGIAKITQPAEQGPGRERTIAAIRALTPEYASPEQWQDLPVTTASDVYSLGVVLYGLLTGTWPYVAESNTPSHIEQAVRNQAPRRPSAAIGRLETTKSTRDEKGEALLLVGVSGESLARLRKELAGDLDAIILKSLERDPSQRYSSVQYFADDIRRVLGGQPVQARLPTLRYRASKFVRRHATAVSSALVIAIAFIIAVGWIVHAERSANRERARAEQRFNDVRVLANSLIFDIHDSIKDLPGSTPARKIIVDRALKYLNSLSREANGDPSLQRELATAYERVGDVQGNPYYANLGDISGALVSYRHAAAIREALVSNDSDDISDRWSLYGNYIALTASSEAKHDFPGALENARKAAAISENLLPQTKDPATQDRGAGAYYYLGNILAETGDPVAALENYRKALAILNSIQSVTSAQKRAVQTHLAGNYSGIARVLTEQKQLGAATKAQQQATVLLEALSAANPANATTRGFLADSYQFLGADFKDEGNFEQGLQYLRRAEGIYQALRVADSSNVLVPYRLAYTEMSIGEVMLKQGHPNRAIQVAQRALVLLQSLVETHPDNGFDVRGLADAYDLLGRGYEQFTTSSSLPSGVKLQHWTSALASYQKSRAVLFDAQSRGILVEEKDSVVANLNHKISVCDAAIVKFRH